MPDSQPALADVVGRWHGVIDPGSLAWGEAPKFAKARPTIELRENGTFTVVDLPWEPGLGNEYPIPKKKRPIPVVVSESGTWRLSYRASEGSCDIELEFQDASGRGVCVWGNFLRVIGKKPPYRLSYVWQDPDASTPVYFDRERSATNQSVASPSAAAASSPSSGTQPGR